MSRSGYNEDGTDWDLIRYRGQVASAIRGKRGQRLLRDLVTALDAMPEKKLIAEDLITSEGEVCALGAVGVHRGIKDRLEQLDPYDPMVVAEVFDIAWQLAAEVSFINDEAFYWGSVTPEKRWQKVREWAIRNLAEEKE